MAKRNSSNGTVAVTGEVLRTYTTRLPCRLTVDETRERGMELAQVRMDVEAHRARAAEVKADLKAEETRLETELTRLAHIVNAKQEPRDVDVEVRASSKPGYVDEVRTDTGEVVHTRRMQPEEAQRGLLDVADEYAAAFTADDKLKAVEGRR